MKRSDRLGYAHALGSANKKFAPSLWWPASNSHIRPVMPDAK